MATTIRAGNATNSFDISPDNTGTLAIKTGTGAGTDAITIDASQNVSVTGAISAPSAAIVGAIDAGSVSVGGVPAITEGMTLLGTLNTTSGSTQTLSGLNLSGYKFMICALDGVSRASATGGLLFAGLLISSNLAAAANGDSGTIMVDLSTGSFSSVVQDVPAGVAVDGSSVAAVGRCGYTNATTSIVFGISAATTFDGGTIKVYGVK